MGVAKTYFGDRVGGRSSAWLEPQIVDLAVAGSNPVGHPNPVNEVGFCDFRHISCGFDKIEVKDTMLRKKRPALVAQWARERMVAMGADYYLGQVRRRTVFCISTSCPVHTLAAPP